MEETITISLMEYNTLVEDSNFLTCLRSAGVDNWEGCDYAYDIYEEYYKKEEK